MEGGLDTTLCPHLTIISGGLTAGAGKSSGGETGYYIASPLNFEIFLKLPDFLSSQAFSRSPARDCMQRMLQQISSSILLAANQASAKSLQSSKILCTGLQIESAILNLVRAFLIAREIVHLLRMDLCKRYFRMILYQLSHFQFYFAKFLSLLEAPKKPLLVATKKCHYDTLLTLIGTLIVLTCC